MKNIIILIFLIFLSACSVAIEEEESNNTLLNWDIVKVQEYGNCGNQTLTLVNATISQSLNDRETHIVSSNGTYIFGMDCVILLGTDIPDILKKLLENFNI